MRCLLRLGLNIWEFFTAAASASTILKVDKSLLMYFMLPVHLLTSKRVWISIRNLFRTLSMPRVPCMCVKPTTLCLKLQWAQHKKKTVQITLQRSPAWSFLHIDRTIKIVAIRSSQREKEKIEKMSIATLRNCRNSCSLSWLKMQCATVHFDLIQIAQLQHSPLFSHSRAITPSQAASSRNRIERLAQNRFYCRLIPERVSFPRATATSLSTLPIYRQSPNSIHLVKNSFLLSLLFLLLLLLAALHDLSPSLLWRRVWAVLQYINMPCCCFFVLERRESSDTTTRWKSECKQWRGWKNRELNLSSSAKWKTIIFPSWSVGRCFRTAAAAGGSLS